MQPEKIIAISTYYPCYINKNKTGVGNQMV
jgi:hypothetical protein